MRELMPLPASAASTMYPTHEIAVESMMWYPRSRVRSLCHAWKNTRNHPTAYGATVSPCDESGLNPSSLMSCAEGM